MMIRRFSKIESVNRKINSVISCLRLAADNLDSPHSWDGLEPEDFFQAMEYLSQAREEIESLDARVRAKLRERVQPELCD